MGLRDKLLARDRQILELQEELQSMLFDPKALQGKKLMKKMRDLLEENADLGKQLAEGGGAQELKVQLEAERTKSQTLKETLLESYEFNRVLDEENEQLQATFAGVCMKLAEAERSEKAGDKRKVESGAANEP